MLAWQAISWVSREQKTTREKEPKNDTPYSGRGSCLIPSLEPVKFWKHFTPERSDGHSAIAAVHGVLPKTA